MCSALLLLKAFRGQQIPTPVLSFAFYSRQLILSVRTKVTCNAARARVSRATTAQIASARTTRSTATT